MTAVKIVVVGAGVAGLTTALLLSRNPSYIITVAAKHMPGDVDSEYCSPWAGANYLPIGSEESNVGQWERASWPFLRAFAEDHPDSGVCFQDVTLLSRLKDQHSTTGKWFSELMKSDPWYKEVVPNFRRISKQEINISTFTSVCINAAVYLPWLAGQCRKNGIVFKRMVFTHIAEAAAAHSTNVNADLVVNCTGLSSLTLGGVCDDSLQPARGQIVLVRNETDSMHIMSGADARADETTYVMARPMGGGTVLGGSFQLNNWDPAPDPNLSNRIMKRSIQLCPDLVGENQGIEDLSIIKHGVGFRPLRTNGPRVEKENIDGLWVVHNYGHGGYGYQTSFGCGLAVIEEVTRVVKWIQSSKL